MTRVRLGDVAREVRKRTLESSDLPTVGLEHLDSGEVELTRWNEGVETTFTKGFEKGQVLFGRRRAYLHKAVVAPFDGVCSGDITVIAAGDGLSPRLLPFIIQNDALFKHAVEKSAGSLSPRVKWQGLAEFEIELPGIQAQEGLADVLWAAQETKRRYKRLLATCDDVVKSQFVEMFEGKEYPSSCLSTLVSSMRNGLSPSKSGSHRSKVLTLSAITQGHFDSSAWKDGFFTEKPPADKRVSNEDFYVCRGNGNKHLVGTGEYSNVPMKDMVFPDTMIAARIKQEQIILPYLRCAWNRPSTRKQIEASAKTTNGTFKINQTALGNIKLLVPPLELQQEFADFAASVDKSKFAVQQALDELNATTKKILNQELGLGDV